MIKYPIFHVGSDSTSAFFGKGKTTALKVARSKDEFCNAFEALADDLHLPENVITLLERYVCCLYGQENATNVNNARYRMFKLGKYTEDSLPPNYDSLYQHILRVNFENYTRKNSTIPTLDAPSPVGYGWSLTGDTLEITWETQGPAPDSILEFVSCKCRKGCQTKRCSCSKGNLKCTELCQCSNCENSEIDEEELIDSDCDEEDCDDDDEFL